MVLTGLFTTFYKKELKSFLKSYKVKGEPIGAIGLTCSAYKVNYIQYLFLYFFYIAFVMPKI